MLERNQQSAAQLVPGFADIRVTDAMELEPPRALSGRRAHQPKTPLVKRRGTLFKLPVGTIWVKRISPSLAARYLTRRVRL